MARPYRMRQIAGPKPASQVPRWLRPKLTPASITDLGLAHHQNVDAVARGEGTEEILWQMVGGVLTWSRIAQDMQVGVPEMEPQLKLMTTLIERYRDTGRIEYTGDELELARTGAFVMDELAKEVDAYTALQAAVWSEEQTNKMAAECRGRMQA